MVGSNTFSIAPIFEIGRILAARGHTVEFGTLEGQEIWAEKYDFVTKTHILGSGAPADETEREYKKMSDWNIDQGFGPVLETKKFLDASWPSVYGGLKSLMIGPSTRPDFIISDYLVDAVRDMQLEFNVPIAMHWPQMPTMMLPASYIPGYAGLQIDVLTSEHATMWQRIRNELVPIRSLPALFRYYIFLRKMRRASGVHTMLPRTSKPDHLVLVNSCYGVETPKDLPPLVHAIGPVLADEYLPLTEPFQNFLDDHGRVLYMALGTHVLLGGETLQSLVEGALGAMRMDYIDGVIWSIGETARKELKREVVLRAHGSEGFTIGDLLDGQLLDFWLPTFAPQRAVLDHPHTRLYLTHGGASSTNETIWHDVPVITLGVYFDQLQNSLRLASAGVSENLDRRTFTSSDFTALVAKILRDKNGSFHSNCERLKAIARIASRRKYLAADLIEEVLADFEGRQQEGKDRPMHLQTADMRMPKWKAQNWDLYAVVGAGSLFVLAIAVALPVALAKALRV